MNPTDLPTEQRLDLKLVAEDSAAERHRDTLLDQALADTFPASDPVSTLSVDEG